MPAIPAYPHDIWTDDVLLDPHPHYRALRELGPVVWLEAHQMYAVPRYAEARAVLRAGDTFCSGQGVGLNDVINGIGAGTTLMSDGKLHDHLRSVIGPGLTPRALRSIRTSVRQLATELVGRLVAQGSFDAVADLARVLPLTVVPDLVGWPAGGREHLLAWAGATFDLLGPLNSRAEHAIPQAQEMMEFAARTAAEGNIQSGGLGDAILDAARRGELPPSQVPPLIIDYLAPSLDTTISAIGSALWLLATNPDQWAALKTDPTLIPNAFNETVRLESPIRAFSRVATTDTELDGYGVPAEARLIVLYASANRDEQVFDRPDDFDVSRNNAAAHLGFGYGAHGCAGQGLARLEGHAVLQALVDQVEAIEPGRPVRALNNVISAWDSLPVTVHPTRQTVVANA
ncbi:cytochrome P450 [Amycolatopsis jiangsuensis]|uniref:Cytochrome P450 n=1 Tax=Amycolatopsis jiangsuensis TaxID=1181879 RepID=A0A840IN57_9PSEU|nr:cytochrome P450 [Amycolatopsis jiangsuensis]MBB4683323.1 cytochrome P450 [Amycolatopsis jiangsuensis]